jgi:hypothetical protein
MTVLSATMSFARCGDKYSHRDEENQRVSRNMAGEQEQEEQEEQEAQIQIQCLLGDLCRIQIHLSNLRGQHSAFPGLALHSQN